MVPELYTQTGHYLFFFMAASSSSSTVLSHPSTHSRTYDLRSLKPYTLTLTNIIHHVSLPLDRTNYILWRSQFMPVFNRQNLFGFVSGSIPSPHEMVLDATNSPSPNPSYMFWYKIDYTIQSWILTTLSYAALGQMLGLSTSHAMWKEEQDLETPAADAETPDRLHGRLQQAFPKTFRGKS